MLSELMDFRRPWPFIAVAALLGPLITLLTDGPLQLVAAVVGGLCCVLMVIRLMFFTSIRPRELIDPHRSITQNESMRRPTA